MLTLIFWIIVACVIWYCVNRFVPGPPLFKYAIYVILAIWVVFMTLTAFGVQIGPPPSSGHLHVNN